MPGPHITFKAMCGWDNLVHSHSPLWDKAFPLQVPIIFISFYQFKNTGNRATKQHPPRLISRIYQFLF